MKKYYYNNVLSSQNITAKTNIVWVADITEIKVSQQRKFFIFLCIDIHTNMIVAQSCSKNSMASQAIIRCLMGGIKRRFSIVPRLKVIVHTDRGTQFSSQQYKDFTKEFEEIIIPSMSRQNTPTDNAVAERLMRTFKEHKIEGKTFEQSIQEEFLLGVKSHKSTVNIYVKSLNKKPNRKSPVKGPESHDLDVSLAAVLMVEPPYAKSFSDKFGYDRRREEVEKYKLENYKVTCLLEEIAAKRAEVVEKTPFDNFETKLEFRIIDERLKELSELITSNTVSIRKHVESAIEPVNDSIIELNEVFIEEMATLNKKIDILLPKKKKCKQTRPLRDPVDLNLFPIFKANAGESSERRKDLKRSQLRVTYTVLYHCGLRINEIRHLTLEDIETAIDASQFNLIHHKTQSAHIHVLSNQALRDLQSLSSDYSVIFNKYQYKYLFGKYKPVTDKNLIKMVNKDLKNTCKKYNIPFNIKSHSFRINLITSLLKVTSIQNTADIMGHKDIRSTMSYNRYALSKTEIQTLLDTISDPDHSSK